MVLFPFLPQKKILKKWINYNKILRSDVEINLEKLFKEAGRTWDSMSKVKKKGGQWPP